MATEYFFSAYKHPNTWEFLPSITLTRLSDARVLMFSFGNFAIEIIRVHKEEDSDSNFNFAP